VGLLFLLPAWVGIGMAHEVSEFMGCVESAPRCVSLVAAQDDDRAHALGMTEGIDASVRDLQASHENSVCLQMTYQVAYRSIRKIPRTAEFTCRLGELLLIGVRTD
jgi:hypothetical protein